MGRLTRFAAGAAAGAAGVAYARAILRRNASLDRPPVRGLDGSVLPERAFTYSDAARVTMLDVGEGDPLIWVPGADGPKETFRFQLPYFARRYRVVSTDLRSRLEEGDGFDRFTDDLRELMDGLGIERAVLIGQSLGTAISLRFASRFPERVRAIVLANPLAYVGYEHVGFNRVALVPVAIVTTRYLPTVLSRALAKLWSELAVWIFDDSEGADRLIDYALFTGPRTTPGRVSSARVDRLRATDLRPELPGITAPTLVVKGPLDTYCPVSWALEIARALPHAEYAAVEGTGHCSHISRPGAFNRIVDEWLARLPDSSTSTVSGEEDTE